MKRFLSATALIFCLMFGQAQAADVHATTENDNGKIADFYVVTVDKTDYGLKVILHSIGRNYQLNQYRKRGFMPKNGDLYVLLNLGAGNATGKQVTRGNTVLLSYYWDIFKTAMEHK